MFLVILTIFCLALIVVTFIRSILSIRIMIALTGEERIIIILPFGLITKNFVGFLDLYEFIGIFIVLLSVRMVFLGQLVVFGLDLLLVRAMFHS